MAKYILIEYDIEKSTSNSQCFDSLTEAQKRMWALCDLARWLQQIDIFDEKNFDMDYYSSFVGKYQWKIEEILN